MPVTPVVDKEKCIGCGACEALCAAVFQLVGGKSQVKKGASCEKAGCCESAATSCPVEAITLKK